MIGQTFIVLMLTIFGAWYAWTIYRTPIDRTHLEVFWGVLGTLIGVLSIQGLLCLHYGYLPWWGILWAPIGFGLTGGWQLLFQEHKFLKMKEDAGNAKTDRQGNGKK